MASLPTVLLILAALSMGATVIAVLIALRSQREAVSAIFPIVREEETIRAQRARISIFIWIAITALFFGGWLATLRLGNSGRMASAVSEIAEPAPESDQPTIAVIVNLVTNTPSPTIELSPPPAKVEAEVEQPTLAPVPTDTPVPTNAPPTPATHSTQAIGSSQAETPTLTPTSKLFATFTSTPVPLTATATETPILPTASPIPTETPTPPTVTSTPPGAIRFPTTPPHTPAPPGVRVGPIQFATILGPDLEPINPSNSFPGDTREIYAAYRVKGMRKGLPIKVVWYLNGVELARAEGEWEWGGNSRSFTFFKPKGKGLYKLELYVNDTIVAANLFEVR